MHILKRVSILIGAVSIVIAPISAPSAHAATTPSLGAASTYGVLGGTFTPNIGNTAITGDAGYTTLSGSGTHTVTGTDYGSGAPTPTARTDAGAALTDLNNQVCTFTFAPGPIDLATDTTHGPLGVFTPGVYCTTDAASIGTGGITLSGSGTFIFKVDGALTSVDNSNVNLTNGASSCDVFWAPTAATTLGANTTFKGTVIDNANAITVGNLTAWIGRALSLGAGTVTTDTNTIDTSCLTASSGGGGGQQYGNINVAKVVVNDSGGTKSIEDFPLFVNGASVVSGVTNQFPAPAPAYTITETESAGYSQVFSGDCDTEGRLALSPGDNKFCIVTNDDNGSPVTVAPVPPLIDVVKVPSPLSLSSAGPVHYTYTLSNIGTVPVTDINMTGDSCSPITLVSGDVNNNQILEVDEEWQLTCSTTLTETHTNTVTTTGWANGTSAVDIASATVVVGGTTVPPLIHVTKLPNKLTLPAGGGVVVYTKRVTNPGTVALSNVRVTDDKCTSVAFIGGDTNSNAMLESSETWTYVCTHTLTATTVNTVTASGDANGLTARDIAVAVVTVPEVPGFPSTGYPPAGFFTNPFSWFFGFLKQFAL